MIFDGYVRISQVKGRSGESFMSPALQREQIERWAAAHGHVIAKVHEELDESGSRADRPMLQEMLGRVEAGAIEGVVVAKLDRFGRSLLDGLVAIERIREAGGTFTSVKDGFDLNSDTGRLVLRIMLAMAEWELDRIRSSWNDARRRAIGRGVHLGRIAPSGYRHNDEHELVVDPSVAPYIPEIFEMRAAGQTLTAIGRHLDDAEVPTALGVKRWTESTLSNVMYNRVYLGELRSGEYVKRDSHPALIDEATWQAAQRPRVVGPRNPAAEHKLAAGLARCGGCGRPLSGGWKYRTSAVHREYICNSASSLGPCPSRVRCRGWELEHVLEEAFFSVQRATVRNPKASEKLAAALRVAEAELVAYRDHPSLLTRLGADRFDNGIAVRVARVEKAALAVDRERAKHGLHRHQRTASQWIAVWPSMTIAQRRHAIGEVIDNIFAVAGPGPLESRTWVCARGDGPIELPHYGRAAARLLSFDPAAYRTINVRPQKPWPQDHIATALRAYLDAVGSWPLDQDFLSAGHGPLLRQIDAQGGQDAWARKLGLHGVKISYRNNYWTDQRVRASLTEIMRTREVWPAYSHWTAIAPGGLSAAIRARHRWWAQQLGYPLTPTQVRRWTPELIASTVAHLAKTTGTYPTNSQFCAAGFGGLSTTIGKGIGHRALARELGLEPCALTQSHWTSHERRARWRTAFA